MNTSTNFGPGDPETWTPCSNHHNDPRTPEEQERITAAHEVCEEIRLWLNMAEQGLQRCDLAQFAAAIESAREHLNGLDFAGEQSS